MTPRESERIMEKECQLSMSGPCPQSVVNFANIIQAAFTQIFFSSKKLQTQTVSIKNLFKTLMYYRAAHKMLLKLTPDCCFPQTFLQKV